MTDLSIIYGIGATKAGTSWLHNALAAHPDVYARGVKESHFWSGEYDRRAAVLEKKVTNAPQVRRADYRDLLELTKTQGDRAAYVDYLTKGQGDEPNVMDTTPYYSTLDRDTLRDMAKLAPTTKFIYIMRDPVARVWSHIRMVATDTGKGLGVASTAVFNDYLSGGRTGIDLRSDYTGTLDKLAAVLPKKDVVVMFYEDLISQSGFDRLLASLDLAPQRAPLKVRVLEGPKVPLQNDQRDQLQHHLAPQYAGVHARMGWLPFAWHQNWMRN